MKQLKLSLWFLAGLLIGGLSIWNSNAYAADEESTWLAATVRSYHLNREVEHHESNFGLGMEYHFNPTWRVVVGYYDNSYQVHSNYIGGMWMPVDLGRGWRFGAMAVMITGYDDYDKKKYQPAVAPMFTWEDERFGADVMTLVGGAHKGVLGLQLKVKF